MKRSLPAVARALGRRLESLWKERGEAPSAFAELARRCLEEARPHEADPAAVAPWLLSTSRLPAQFGLHNDFGEPSLTLYSSAGFVVELLHWLKPLPNVHDHPFTGAFTVLRGRSLHLGYAFDAAEGRGEALVFGERRLTGASLLGPGPVKAIPWGPGFIHQVWHLSRPSLSLLVRTRAGFYQHFDYQGPSLAVSMPRYIQESLLHPPLVRRLDLIRHLAGLDAARAGAYAAEAVAGSDLLGGYLALRRLFTHVADPAARETALAAARRKHGRERVEAIRRGVVEAVAAESIPWEALPEPEQRLAAALEASGAVGAA